MHLLYFFRHWGPHLVGETFQAVPSQMEGVTASIFPTIPVGLGTKISVAGQYYPTLSQVLSSIKFPHSPCLRPYHLEYTSSRPITEVKQG